MADKLRTAQQLETLQSRYIGTGHADTTKAEWTSNIMRDSYASYVGHLPLLSYLSLGMGECRERVRMKFVEGVVRGAGQQKDTHDEEESVMLGFDVGSYGLSRPETDGAKYTDGVKAECFTLWGHVHVLLVFCLCLSEHVIRSTTREQEVQSMVIS
ncbi:hypothetical protein LTR66_005014 [Elasticomyces elasticus]|nr:hypothetical protein LTR66_005014 [Elasticomyces elasticus]